MIWSPAAELGRAVRHGHLLPVEDRDRDRSRQEARTPPRRSCRRAASLWRSARRRACQPPSVTRMGCPNLRRVTSRGRVSSVVSTVPALDHLEGAADEDAAMGRRVLPGRHLRLVERRIAAAVGQRALDDEGRDVGQHRGNDQTVASGHFGHHDECRDRRARGPGEDGSHADHDERGGNDSQDSGRRRPARARRFRRGALPWSRWAQRRRPILRIRWSGSSPAPSEGG